jgi:hypothetical protein
MDELISRMIMEEKFDDAIKVLEDPNLENELFHKVTMSFQSPNYELENPKKSGVLPEIDLGKFKLRGIDDKQFFPYTKWEHHNVETVLIGNEKIRFEVQGLIDLIYEHVGKPKNLEVTAEVLVNYLKGENVRFVFGSTAICLYNMFNGREASLPKNINSISFVPRRDCLKTPNFYYFFKGELMKKYDHPDGRLYSYTMDYSAYPSRGQNTNPVHHKEVKDFLKENNMLPNALFDLYSIQMRFYKEDKVMNHCKNFLVGNSGEEPEKLKDFLCTIDLSVSGLIYDVEEEKFLFMDSLVEDEVKNKVTRYHDQPFNYYLDRFGEKRLKTDALKRILKYFELGFRIKKNENEYFTKETVWKLIMENSLLENTNYYSNDPITLIEKRNYLIKKGRFYGLHKSLFQLSTINLNDKKYDMKEYEYISLEKEDLKTTVLSQDMSKGEMKMSLKKLIGYLRSCLHLGGYNSFMISGSTMLSLELPDEESFIPGDLDVWIDIRTSSILLEGSLGETAFLKGVTEFLHYIEDKFGVEKRANPESVSDAFRCDSYGEDNVKNYLYTLDTFGGTFKIQFIFKTSSIKYGIVDGFDMDFCKVVLINNLIIKNIRAKKAIGEKASLYMPKSHSFTEEGDDLVLTKKHVDRVNKYIARGFKLFFMGKTIIKGEDVRIPNGKNENLEYFFMDR